MRYEEEARTRVEDDLKDSKLTWDDSLKEQMVRGYINLWTVLRFQIPMQWRKVSGR